MQVVHADEYVHSTYVQVLGEYLYSAINRVFRTGCSILVAGCFPMGIGKIIANDYFGVFIRDLLGFLCKGLRQLNWPLHLQCFVVLISFDFSIRTTFPQSSCN